MAEPAVKLIKPRDVAKMLSVGMTQVYRLAKDREIPSVTIGKSIRFDPADVLEYIRAQRRERKMGA